MEIYFTFSSIGLAFRGHERENLECFDAEGGKNYFQSNHEGNFLGLVKLLSTENIELRRHLIRCAELQKNDSRGSRRGANTITYLSPKFVDSVLNTTKDVIIEDIVNEINRCGGKFGLAVDATTDISTKHQSSIVVRYVNEQCNVTECTIAICEQSDTTGAALYHMVQSALERVGLKLENIVGFSFDGASNMYSDRVGLTHHIHQISPASIYVWCFAHRFNLTVKHSCSASLSVNYLLEIVNKIASFFRGSHKRMDTWMSAAKSVPNYTSSTRLKLIGQTRWSSKQDAVKNIVRSELHLFVVIKALLQICNLSGLQGDALVSACHLLESFTKYDNIVSLILLQKIFEKLSPVTLFLQTHGLNIIDATKAIETVYNTVAAIQMNESDVIKAETFIRNVNSMIRADAYILSLNTPIEIHTPTGDARQLLVEKCREMFESFHERIRMEIERLFIDEFMAEDAYEEISYLDISCPEQWINNSDYMHFDKLCKLTDYTGPMPSLIEELKMFVNEFHQDQMDRSISLIMVSEDEDDDENEEQFLPTAAIDGDDGEFDVAQPISLNDQIITHCSCVECVLKYVKSSSDLSTKYANVFELYRVVAALPSTQVKCERDFSRLKYTKNRLRTSMSTKKLQNLMIISSASSRFKKINLETILCKVASTSRSLSVNLF